MCGNPCLFRRLQASNAAASDVDNLKEIARLKAELQNAENTNKNLNNNIMQLTMNLSTSENKLSRATAEITTLEGQLQSSAADLAKANQEVKTTQDQVAAAKKRIEIMEITLKVSQQVIYSCFEIADMVISPLFPNEMVLPIICLSEKQTCRLPIKRFHP